MDSWTLFIAAAQSSAQILLVILTGYVCARQGIVTLTVQKGLSNLTVKVLTPCLLVSRVAEGVDMETLAQIWPIPAFFAIFSVISASLGVIGGKVLRLSIPQTKFVSTGIIFNNLTSLSLGLLKSISGTEAIRLLTWGEDDTPELAATRGISYILLATILSNFLRWSLGAYLLKKEEEPSIPKYDEILDEEQTVSSCLNGESSNLQNSTETTPLFTASERRPRHSRSRVTTLIFKLLTNLKDIMNPPLYAAIIALIIGTIPSLKGLFFGPGAPLSPTLTQAVRSLGDATVPLTLLVLGAQLNNFPRTKGLRQMYPAISWVMTSRFIIMPTIGISFVWLTRSWYLNDPMFLFVLMLLAGGPTAVNCMNLAQLTGAFQEEMATLLFYSYLAVAPMITITIMIMFMLIREATTIEKTIFLGRSLF